MDAQLILTIATLPIAVFAGVITQLATDLAERDLLGPLRDLATGAVIVTTLIVLGLVAIQRNLWPLAGVLLGVAGRLVSLLLASSHDTGRDS